jgi:hypothetical protein
MRTKLLTRNLRYRRFWRDFTVRELKAHHSTCGRLHFSNHDAQRLKEVT